MRLLFSIAVLLVLACVVLEISAAKSSRDAEATKSNHKSGNSKEVRYSKNKSDSKKKGNGKKGEMVKEKYQRLNVEGNERIESSEFSKKNQKKLNEKQKEQKTNKQVKVHKTGENSKDKKNVKVNKDASRKYKRSIETEKPEESLSRNDDSRVNSASKKGAKNKFEKKSVNGGEKAFDAKLESETILNAEKGSDDQSSGETASSLDNNVKSLKKNKNSEEQRTKSKKTKQQKHSHNSEESCKEAMDLEESKSAEAKIQVFEKLGDLETKTESLDTLAQEKTRGVNQKKHKCSKKESNSLSECEAKVPKEKSKKYESGSCDLEAKISPKEGRIDMEQSEHVAKNEQHEADDEDSKDVDTNSADENETQEEESVEAGDCTRAKNSVEEDTTRESHSTV